MKNVGMGAAVAVGALAILFSAAPLKIDAETGVLAVQSAEARVFKHGSNQRVGSVNPADPGKLTDTSKDSGKGQGKGGDSGGKGKGGKNK